MSIYLSKSRYCSGKQCPKKLWMEIYKPEEAEIDNNENVFITGKKVGELAKGLFGNYIDIPFNKDLQVMIDETKKHMQNKPNIITEASFSYNNNFCSVDILKNMSDGVELYEVKSSTSSKEVYEDDIAYQVYVLKNNGLNIKSANLVHINKKYVRQGELELDKLFKIEDITKIALNKQKEIQEKIKELEKHLTNNEEPLIDLSKNCFKPYSCPFWSYCSKTLPEKNVFTLRGINLSKKLEYYISGIVKYEDLLGLVKNKKTRQQITADLTNEVYIDKEQIKKVLDNYTYPLYFLDFETFEQAIPEFDGIRPYMKIPFQYSLHYIEKEGSKLEHKEFLAETGKDPRRDLAEQLVKDIPKNVCVLAYNMSFEKMVIKELAKTFEDLSDHLLNIRENIQDLMIPFSKGWFYSNKMEGSYSIKKVLPTLCPNIPEYDYSNLDIVHNGEEASSIFENLGSKTKEEQEKIRKALLEYCNLDTLAMVKVWEKLKQMI